MDRDSLDTLVSGSRASDADSSIRLDTELAFETGQIILNCKPFVHIITDEMKGTICDLCLRPATNKGSALRCCADCQQIYFCKSCLTSSTPSIFKTIHLLECSIYAEYGQILSNPTKLFLRLLFRQTRPESIPHQNYYNPLTKEEITFEHLVPRIVYNSHDEMGEHIKSFCEQYNLKLRDNNQTESGDRKMKKKKDSKPNYKSIAEFTLKADMPVEEVAIFQFMNLLDEFSKCPPLVPLLVDDLHIYQLWTMFVRLWSYTTPICDETITGLFSTDTAIAYALYLEPNVLLHGHSCLPNTAFAYYGPVLQLRAMKPIYSGDSLTVNLVNVSIPEKERLHQLRSYFISQCFCPRCTKKEQAIDYESFQELKHEFVSAYLDEFSTPNKSMSLSAILNFSNSASTEEATSQLYQNCARIREMCKKLSCYYNDIYPFFHPEKSRFLFAELAVELNLLLFKLDGIDANEEEKEKDPNRRFSAQTKRISDCSEFSTKNSNLDYLTDEIHNWSDLLKRTIRTIRWTHGVDHKIYRQMPIALSSLWRQALGNRTLTLSELHRDPTILLRILCSSNRKQSSFFLGQIEMLTSRFSQLLGDTVESSSASLAAMKCAAVTCPTVVVNSSSIMWRVLGRTLLVLFAFLFPFFIYYIVYVEDL